MIRLLFNLSAALSLALCLFAAFAMSTSMFNDHPDFGFRASLKLFVVFAVIPLIWLMDCVRRRRRRDGIDSTGSRPLRFRLSREGRRSDVIR